MPDLVQAVGRALRMKPGEGKTASLVVPILLKPGESAASMLTSKAYGDLAKLLEALRAHDARVVETLGQAPSPTRTEPDDSGDADIDDVDTEPREGDDEQGPSAGARELLKFSTPGILRCWQRSSSCGSWTLSMSTGVAGSKPPSSTRACTAVCACPSPSASPEPRRPRTLIPGRTLPTRGW